MQKTAWVCRRISLDTVEVGLLVGERFDRLACYSDEEACLANELMRALRRVTVCKRTDEERPS